MLWNLPDTYLEFLLTRIKEPWDTEILPSAWQEVLVILIPKPEKPPDQITNLRPISVTSCTGKLKKKMVLKRLEWRLYNHNVLHYMMMGSRKHACMEDAMVRIYEYVCQHPSTSQLRTIGAVDICKAFDTVTHRLNLENLLETRPGFKI